MKTIVVLADLNQESLSTLRRLRTDLDLKHAQMHFVHVFEIRMYNADLVPIVFPSEEQYPEIEQSSLAILRQLSDDLGIKSEHSTQKCFFSHSREEKVRSYLAEVSADLVVVATRGKHGIEGFFSSSLADFLTKYSPCDILILRPSSD
jgi:nucleotide-binding universal stress UspA family protein